MSVKNVTRRVEFAQPVGDALPITKCVCGESFQPWQFVVSVDKENPSACPKCGRRLFWNANIRVYQVE